MIGIKQFSFNPFGENTYIVYDDDSRDAIVVDPGMTSPQEQQRFDSYISDNRLKIRQIVNTHLHLDHCFGDNYVRDKYGVKVSAPLGEHLPQQAEAFGIVAPDMRPVHIDIPLADGDNVALGKYSLEVIHIPGHSAGSIAIYSPDYNFVLSGDALFRGSIGRTDLPGGNHSQLVQSIRTRLLTLPAATEVHAGHDRPTTIGAEARTNPYIV